MTRITAVFFDLGDTLWHFPAMPAGEIIRNETVRRIKELIESWGEEVTEGRYFLGRDIRMAVEQETSRAFHGDCLDPGYPELCRRVAAEHGLALTAGQGGGARGRGRRGARLHGRQRNRDTGLDAVLRGSGEVKLPPAPVIAALALVAAAVAAG